MLDPVHEPGNAEEPLSPELALIDPEAADRARRRLPAIESLRGSTAHARARADRSGDGPDRAGAARGESRRLSAATAATILAVTLAGAGVLGAAYLIDRGGQGRSPHLRPTDASRRSFRRCTAPLLRRTLPARSARASHSCLRGSDPNNAGTSSARTLPAFAWPQAPHAHEYRITSRLGDRVVYSASTTTTQLHVAPSGFPPASTAGASSPSMAAGRPIGTPVIDSMLTVH